MAGSGSPWQVLVARDGFSQLVCRQLLELKLLLLAHPVFLVVFRLERVPLPEVPGLIQVIPLMPEGVRTQLSWAGVGLSRAV